MLRLPRLVLRKKMEMAVLLASPMCLARISSAGGFDLDHIRSMVGHHHRQMRTRQELRQIDDSTTFELHDSLHRARSPQGAKFRLRKAKPPAARSRYPPQPSEQTRAGRRCPSSLMGLASVMKSGFTWDEVSRAPFQQRPHKRVIERVRNIVDGRRG